MRRTQQLDCYAAEEALDSGVRFADVAAAQRWVDDLRDTPWWHLQGYSLAVLRIEVDRAGANNKRWGAVSKYESSKNAGLISVNPKGLNAKTMLHEVAHVLADAMHDSTGHDPAWARTYLTLVSCVLGADAYLTLQRSFDAHGVSYDVPTRTATSAFAL